MAIAGLRSELASNISDPDPITSTFRLSIHPLGVLTLLAL